VVLLFKLHSRKGLPGRTSQWLTDPIAPADDSSSLMVHWISAISIVIGFAIQAQTTVYIASAPREAWPLCWCNKG